MMIIIV